MRQNPPKRTPAEAKLLSWLGPQLQRAREALGLSIPQLAARAGVDRVFVAGVERGIRNPSIVVLCKLAEALQTSPGELLRDAPQISLVEATTR